MRDLPALEPTADNGVPVAAPSPKRKKPRRERILTEQELAKIREDILTGCPRKSIAKRYRISQERMRRLVTQFKTPRRRVCPICQEEFTPSRKQQTHCTKILCRRRISTEAQKERRRGIEEALRKGYAVGEVAKRFKVGQTYVTTLRKKANVAPGGKRIYGRRKSNPTPYMRQVYRDTHLINLVLGRHRSEPRTTIAFRLDNELYVKLMRWAELRHVNITQAIKMMIVREVGLATDQRSLMERLDDWIVEGVQFVSRSDAMRGIIAKMVAKG